MLALHDIVETSRAVAGESSRLAKIERLADLIRRAPPHEAATAVAWLTGELPQGRIGVGPAAVRAALEAAHADAATLGVSDVDAVFTGLAALSGTGSARRRGEALQQLFEQATASEQEFLARLLWGELRQGALAGVMADAVAKAANVPVAAVRRAAQYAGDLPAVVRAALEGGSAALAAFGVTLFRPVQPMLAQPADDAAAAMARLRHAALDYKLDGARVQVHRQGDEVRVYSRRLNDVTAAVPELVEQALTLPVHEIVLDGEVIAMRSDGRPAPFQVTMSRFGSRVDVDRLREDVPLSTYFFDCLLLDGESLMERETARRMQVMDEVLPAGIRVPRLVTGDADAAHAFLRQARAAGHEGLVAKALDASYEAGSRGGAWLKIKEADTLDLVVLAAEWGSGRRRGWLSNLHLGARDEQSGGFVMLGKTFKGLTDVLLEWQTKALLEREVAREGNVVHVRPELVVEIAFEGVQTSRRYPAGMALRFARVRRYRTDKSAAEADTLERVRLYHVT
ncbi:MAG TPA: ATP-dependent DNA ligase [Longimicrobiales bacterium]|nr:ATP-dependent DNA ligase [Longimicrobiales bacterium]